MPNLWCCLHLSQLADRTYEEPCWTDDMHFLWASALYDERVAPAYDGEAPDVPATGGQSDRQQARETRAARGRTARENGSAHSRCDRRGDCTADASAIRRVATPWVSVTSGSVVASEIAMWLGSVSGDDWRIASHRYEYYCWTDVTLIGCLVTQSNSSVTDIVSGGYILVNMFISRSLARVVCSLVTSSSPFSFCL